MRVAAVQYEVGTDPQANLAAGLRLIDAAAGQGAELIVLPEFCNHLSWYESREHARALACRHGDAFLTAIAARAARHRAHVKLGVTLARRDGRTTGASLLYGPGGELLGEADKQVLMGAENDHLDPGDTAGPVVRTAVGRLGMYACMEGVICEVTRGLALRGAQVLLNSLNSFAVDEAALHVPVRAAENKVWVVAANKVGPLIPADRLAEVSAGLGVPVEWLHGAGESQVVAPDGTVMARGPRTGEAVVVADIDPPAADAGRARHFATRRPGRYLPLAAPGRERTGPPGAPALPVAVVRGDAGLVRRAVDGGARLVVLPEGSKVTVEEAADAVKGTDAHVVTGAGVLVGADGAIQQADGVYDLPWGRLAVITGSAARHPEEFRLAALADADVVAVPFTPAEPWELRLGLLERSAENRLNIVAAGQDGPGGLAGAILALPADFTLWTRWQGPFTGQISHPMVTHVKNADLLVQGTVHPAQSVNRLVSRGTDLVAGRPWRLAGALVAGPSEGTPVKETLQHVEQMLDESPVIDVTETFERLKGILEELKARIDARFELSADPGSPGAYGTHPDGPGGRLDAYAGPEIDWLVHSWLGNPAASFANLHLTAWLGPHIRVPHLGIALLVWPEGWFYQDFIPRASLTADGGHFDRYYAPLDAQWLAFKEENPDFAWFTSRAGFIRASLSPNAYCYSFPRSPGNLDIVRDLLHARVGRWLEWVDEAEPVPEGERAALAAADLAVRRNIAERDPANVMGVRYFGQELTDRLVRGLWGGDRTLPRPS
ncbi:hypothetical protein GCM10009850_070880 [Nonomuraea monospora]|uniref:CN hydrolase domain-containing protein n=1 Tax=Nonomuraea monospora TaxID=568818 RepID=A0ABP5PM54_9ACTN